MKRTAEYSRGSALLRNTLRFTGLFFSAVLLVVTIHLFIQQQNNAPAKVQVVIAKQDIPAQTSVTQDMLILQEYIEGFVPQNAFTPDSAGAIIGKKALITIRSGDILLPSQFGSSQDGSNLGIATLIPKGQRLVYLKKSDVHAIPPDIQTGHQIQISAVNTNANNPTAEILISGVAVAEVLRSADNAIDAVEFVGLFVTPEQEQVLTARLASDWTLHISLLPTNEKVTSTVNEDALATPEATVRTPTPIDEE